MNDVRDSSAAENKQSHLAESGATNLDTAQAVVTAGHLLKQAREAAGLHIAALAVSLKVPAKKLEALEADNFDLLPDIVFVRALASSVCRTLKIDAVPVLDRLPKGHSPKLAAYGRGINTPFHAPGDGPGPSIWAHVSRPAVLAGLVLLLGTLALLFLLPAVKAGADSSSADVASRAVNSPFLMSSTGEAVSGAVPAPQAAVAALPRPAPDSASPLPLPAAALLGGSAMPARLAGAAAPVMSTDTVVFSAHGASWVEVTDSKKVVVLRRTLSAGEVVGASGALPLTATVGRADATRVQIRGQAFDLIAIAKDNVARFEVK